MFPNYSMMKVMSQMMILRNQHPRNLEKVAKPIKKISSKMIRIRLEKRKGKEKARVQKVIPNFQGKRL